jgi:hypothetical protein
MLSLSARHLTILQATENASACKVRIVSYHKNLAGLMEYGIWHGMDTVLKVAYGMIAISAELMHVPAAK